MTVKTIRLSLTGLYRWGYTQDRGISFLTNVIQCHCGQRYRKMRGLWQLVTTGREVRVAQFDLFSVMIDGKSFSISVLETPEQILKGIKQGAHS